MSFLLMLVRLRRPFSFIFKTENFKFIPDEYAVQVSSKGISHFRGERIEYWVATEAGSKYGA